MKTKDMVVGSEYAVAWALDASDSQPQALFRCRIDGVGAKREVWTQTGRWSHPHDNHDGISLTVLERPDVRFGRPWKVGQHVVVGPRQVIRLWSDHVPVLAEAQAKEAALAAVKAEAGELADDLVGEVAGALRFMELVGGMDTPLLASEDELAACDGGLRCVTHNGHLPRAFVSQGVIVMELNVAQTAAVVDFLKRANSGRPL